MKVIFQVLHPFEKNFVQDTSAGNKNEAYMSCWGVRK